MAAYIDVDPDDPHHCISLAIAHIGAASRAELEGAIAPEDLIDLLAYCDEHRVRFQGVIDRALHAGWDIERMRADAKSSAEQLIVREEAARADRQRRLEPYQRDLEEIMRAWHAEHPPKSYAQQRHFAREAGAIRRGLEEHVLACGRLPRSL
jgi:hypothetical protein